jgi:hypothetical protein
MLQAINEELKSAAKDGNTRDRIVVCTRAEHRTIDSATKHDINCRRFGRVPQSNGPLEDTVQNFLFDRRDINGYAIREKYCECCGEA